MKNINNILHSNCQSQNSIIELENICPIFFIFLYLGKEPPSSSLEGTVVGYEVGDNCFTVLFTIGEDFQTFTIALDILVEFLEYTDEEVENTLQQKLPFSCRLQVKDSSVESITN